MISNLPYLYRNTLRVTRAATLSSTDGSAAEGSKYLGKRGKDFDFSHLQNPVNFVECSAKGNGNSDGELNMVVEWIENLVWKEFWDKLFVLLEEKWLRRSANDMQVQWNLVITRSLGPYKLPCYIRVKKLRNIKIWDQQNYLVITGFCYIRPLYNEVSLYLFIPFCPLDPVGESSGDMEYRGSRCAVV